MEIRKVQKNVVNKRNRSSGFTLIELVVAMIIIGIISSLLVVYIMGATEAFARVQSRKSLIIDAASCIKLFTRETSLTQEIVMANSKNILFKSTLDTNIVIDYEINNDGTFTRKFGDGNKELVSMNIDYNNSYFTYYDIYDNVGTPIRRIRLSLLMTRNTESTRFTADIFPETFRTSF